MLSYVRRSTERLQNVLLFCQHPPPPLDTPSILGSNFVPQREVLRDAVARLTRYHMDAASGVSKGATTVRHTLRRALRDEHLDPIRRIVRALANDHPELPQTLQVSRINRGDTVQLSIARAIARDVAPYRDLFVADGLPPDFIDTLNAAIEALAQSVERQRDDGRRRAALNVGVRLALADGRQAIWHLDPLVRLAIRAAGDVVTGAPALAAWERACQLERVTPALSPAAVQAVTPPAAQPSMQSVSGSPGEHAPMKPLVTDAPTAAPESAFLSSRAQAA